ATGESTHPGPELSGQRSVEIEGAALRGQLLGGRRWAQHQPHRIAGRDMQQYERQNHDAEHDGDTGEETLSEPGEHRRESRAASDGPLECGRVATAGMGAARGLHCGKLWWRGRG